MGFLIEIKGLFRQKVFNLSQSCDKRMIAQTANVPKLFSGSPHVDWRERKMAQTMEESVLRILQSPEVSRINFRLLGVEVSGRAYREIADKILEGHFTVPEEIDAELAREGSGAAYSAYFNKFRFGGHRYGFREWQSYVVHEATHALVDYRKIQISRIDDEAVAHVAHTLYLRRAGFGFKSHGVINKTWYAAAAVADSIIHSGMPDGALVKKLQEAVRSDPDYHELIGKTAFADG
jgi:hypothetical protein